MPFSAWKITCTSAGTKLATRVGRPKPRFTVMPSRSSRAMRSAINSRVNPCGAMFAPHARRFCRSGEPADLVMLAHDDPIDVDPRRYHLLRVQIAGRNDLIYLRDHEVGRGGHRHVEVAAAAAVDEIAHAIAAPGF